MQKPVDLDHLATHLRKFLTVRSSAPLHEKRVADLMVPLDAYRSLGEDRSVREALELLYGNSTNTLHGSVSEGMYRSIVIRRTDGSYRGVLRYTDLLDQLIPRMFWDGAHGPFYTGMFLAQCKVFGNVRVGDLEGLDEQIAVAAEAPLMQALVLMREARLCNMPVKRSGQVVGLLRDRDLFLLVCQNILL
ncbi:MAG: hypothetical protein A2284_17260 [Deltaproteobacteria bacterium RIFOXYA12_FULL_61_11]|nr:MAG: hypothetical protein A2284_17260 [Deltaproteobacteria bacterium RIFOXYA12_FULL_61_11]